MRKRWMRGEGTRSHATGARLEKVFLSSTEPRKLNHLDTKQRPGAGFRPGAIPEFQFDESTDLRTRVKRHL
jgi:hypothetical protein